MDDMKEIKKELRKREIKEKLSNAKDKAVDFWNSNREAICIGAPLLIGGIRTVSNTVRKHETIKADRDHRELDHYDPRTGEWSHARKRLTKSQRLELNRRYSAGESKIQILEDLGVLK